MNKMAYTLLCLLFVINITHGQDLSQTLRGSVLDTDSALPLIGAEVFLIGSDPLIGTTTNELGEFRLEEIPLGRVSIRISYLGYEDKTISNIVLRSGKEVVLNLELEESVVQIEDVVVTAYKDKGKALNDMALISARSISAEETNRYAGGFNDPSRIMSNFAGVTNTADGSNDIIVRGNSPKYIQWRLEGIEITNPNHFADQSSVGGSISTLNNNLLATSDFYTGAFSPEYGDVLSGVYDVKLRAGNNEKFESVFGFGLLGTDITLEGPFKKDYGGSYLLNYRYNTASIAQDLGLIDIAGIPKFQDAAFKVLLPTKKIGTFSLFGLAGLSSFLLEDVKPSTWQTVGNNSMIADINEDFKKSAFLLNTGLKHSFSINQNSFIKTTLSYSNEGYTDEVTESNILKLYASDGTFVKDSILNKKVNYKGKLRKSSYRAAITYNHKFNAKNKIQIGTKYSLIDLENSQSQLKEDGLTRFSMVDFKENIATVQNFISWKHRFNEKLSIVSGLHNMTVLYNQKNNLEPRLAMSWQVNKMSSIHAGFGFHSNMESIHHYFTKIEQENGSVHEPNKDLGLLKGRHYLLGYEKRFGKNIRAKVETYYQELYNLPVENNDTSYFSTINESLNFKYVELINKGRGKNYGIELTLERFFNHHFYYLINASFFESKYTSLEGVERNTSFNGNFLFNILCGKEFENLGKKKNQILALNAKLFYGGGRKIIPLLRDESGQLDVDPDTNQFWDYSKAYEKKIENIYLVTISASYRWNKKNVSHELFLNLDNLTNTKGKISEYYDEDEPNSIGYVTQFGFFPNLMYRVYF